MTISPRCSTLALRKYEPHHRSTFQWDPLQRSLSNVTTPNYVEVASGSGPRHMVLAKFKHGRVAHVLCEMGSFVSTFEVKSKTGALGAEISRVPTLPADPADDGVFNKAAEIVLAPGGECRPLLRARQITRNACCMCRQSVSVASLKLHFVRSGGAVWVSNRGFSAGSNTICLLEMDAVSGALTAAKTCVSSGGTFPRGVALATGEAQNYLLVGGQDSENIATFVVEKGSNQLKLAQNLTGVVTPVTFA